MRLDLVVYLFHRNKDALFKALLTERVSLNIAVTNPFPCSAVLFIHLRVTTVLLVVLLYQPAMLFQLSGRNILLHNVLTLIGFQNINLFAQCLTVFLLIQVQSLALLIKNM